MSSPSKRERTRLWKLNNPEKVKRNYDRWVEQHPGGRKEINVRAQLKRYGLTRDDYDRMSRQQNDLCAICARPETTKRLGKLRSLCVDHDHSTGRVRGLLCSSCNRAVGFLGDDPLRARSLSAYLETR